MLGQEDVLKGWMGAERRTHKETERQGRWKEQEEGRGRRERRRERRERRRRHLAWSLVLP